MQENKTKLGFCFLTVRGLNHPNIWKKFLFESGLDDKHFKVFSHAKYPIIGSSDFLNEFEIKEKAKTRWEFTMNAQILLYKAALESDSGITHLVLLSDSCVPLHPLGTRCPSNGMGWSGAWCSALSSLKDRSRLCTFKRDKVYDRHCHNTRMIRKEYFSQNNYTMFNHQWMILSRRHAEMMINDTEVLPKIAGKCFADNEFYPSVFFHSKGMLDKGVIDNEIENKIVTFVDWTRPGGYGRHPYTFSRHIESDYRLLLKARSSCLFARKFSSSYPEFILERFLHEAEPTIIACDPTGGSANVFDDING